MNTLSDRQAAELREIADGGRDTNRHLWTRAFRDGRDHARSRLRDLLDSEDRDTFETAANEMDAEALLFEDWFSDGFSSVIDEVCAVLPSWPDLYCPMHRAWLFWSPVGTLAAVVEYPEPVTAQHAQARYAADGDMPAAEPEPVAHETLPAIRALIQQTAGTGRHITRDDLKEIQP